MWRIGSLIVYALILALPRPLAAQQEDEVSLVFDVPFGAETPEERERGAVRAILRITEADPYALITCASICKRATPPEDPIEIDLAGVASGLHRLTAPVPLVLQGLGQDAMRAARRADEQARLQSSPVVSRWLGAVEKKIGLAGPKPKVPARP